MQISLADLRQRRWRSCNGRFGSKGTFAVQKDIAARERFGGAVAYDAPYVSFAYGLQRFSLLGPLTLHESFFIALGVAVVLGLSYCANACEVISTAVIMSPGTANFICISIASPAQNIFSSRRAQFEPHWTSVQWR